ncbi:Uncharacterized protein HZ326_29652 [Fusarium oxysporum f. sp. albedinis]|nr:Uncharacterized protein HZ326_29652 [Fusarium oxysporum f. sp. albedinis]
MIYYSGAVSIDLGTNKLVSCTVINRTCIALQNLKAVLEAAGSSLDRMVKANIFPADIKDFDDLNIAWDELFPNNSKPLPLGTDVEIEMTASYD